MFTVQTDEALTMWLPFMYLAAPFFSRQAMNQSNFRARNLNTVEGVGGPFTQ